MTEPRVLVFFYGSYMNRRVLAEVDLVPESWEPASLAGFDIRIAPRANLVRAPGRMVFGALATATHRELERLYAHAHDMVDCPAEAGYVPRIVEPALELGFPDWYVARLESFRP
jgi:hypothetical protein